MIALEMLNDVSYVTYRTSPRTFQCIVFFKSYIPDLAYVSPIPKLTEPYYARS
jgi:hypothetical protein